jgi:pyruvate ferredoxin oxidoreductase gamma subunit
LIIRVRFHGRGGQGAKTASRILGNAAFNDGYYVQDFPLYGAERRGAPVAAFTRFSNEEITERGFIFGPDLVAVMDDSLMGDQRANPLGGLRRGGFALINTDSPAEKVSTGRKDVEVSTLDLTGLALKILGKPILSAAVAAAVARVTGISEVALLAGIEGELHEVGLSDETVRKNLELAKEVYRALEPRELHTTELESGEELVPVQMVVAGDGTEDVLHTGNSALRHTGDWRTYRPSIDYKRCTDCMICYAYCPESAMSVGEDGRVLIDYDNCKGCMICMTECPLRAITQLREGAPQ